MANNPGKFRIYVLNKNGKLRCWARSIDDYWYEKGDLVMVPYNTKKHVRQNISDGDTVHIDFNKDGLLETAQGMRSWLSGLKFEDSAADEHESIKAWNDRVRIEGHVEL